MPFILSLLISRQLESGNKSHGAETKAVSKGERIEMGGGGEGDGEEEWALRPSRAFISSLSLSQVSPL